MTKCNLTIQLEAPDEPLRGGGRVRGLVRIVSEVDIRCRGLNVAVVASCDGPGGQSETSGQAADVFSGNLEAGKPRECPFEVEVPPWPLAYQGVHFQIRHQLRATADLPWATDPQAAVALQVLPSDLDYPPPDQTKVFAAPNWVVKAISFLFPLVFVLNALGPQLLAVILVSVAVLGLPFWLLLRWYPKWRIGAVDFQLQPLTLTPGDWLTGHLSIRPRGTLKAKQISVRLLATEICESGSGDDRKVERFDIYSRDLVSAEGLELPGDRATRFEINSRLPPIAAYSLKQGSNQLVWAVEAMIGIFGLIRWNETRVLSVVPSRVPGGYLMLRPASDALIFTTVDESQFDNLGQAATVVPGDLPDDEITLDEAAQQFWSARHQQETIAVLLEALEGLPLRAAATIQRRPARVGGAADRGLRPGELAVAAQMDEPPLPLTLYVPRDRGVDFERAVGMRWSGSAEVVGWDDAGNRLQLRVH